MVKEPALINSPDAFPILTTNIFKLGVADVNAYQAKKTAIKSAEATRITFKGLGSNFMRMMMFFMNKNIM